jgi:hypothetical protein
MHPTVFSACMDANIQILMANAQKDLKNMARALLERMTGRTISNCSRLEKFSVNHNKMQKSKRQSQRSMLS